ncbi:OsmC family peroxiredoxin [Hymenobacter oligotrophus]|uniref:OsmC family peroxiredoxin n=1 Tax=Hymenobacter oligotrophus TaxID=2319843 RepID=A0A3B7R3S4_9BACT|nr:OsmC family protein [Hymenobacter oligotrophus]AYA38655.1 OsmC family peroxiredoxin [Hymenobacter oligotrophus]
MTENTPAATQPPPADHTVVVRVGPDALLADVQAGRHTFIIDEPVAVGGHDRGPTPYDMLLSALGACTAITLRLYANQKQWPLEGVEVRLSHGREHRLDCEQCEQEAGANLEVVRKQLRLLGPLTAEQRQRLEVISAKCPVQKTLSKSLRIETTLVPADAWV